MLKAPASPDFSILDFLDFQPQQETLCLLPGPTRDRDVDSSKEAPLGESALDRDIRALAFTAAVFRIIQAEVKDPETLMESLRTARQFMTDPEGKSQKPYDADHVDPNSGRDSQTRALGQTLVRSALFEAAHRELWQRPYDYLEETVSQQLAFHNGRIAGVLGLYFLVV